MLHQQVGGLSGAQPGELLVLDLGAMTFMDSAGWATTIELLKTARRHGLRVSVVIDHPDLVRLFAMTGVQRAFRVCATAEVALSPR